jgi:hypothetical protein
MRSAWRYRQAKKFADETFQVKILFRGTKKECLVIEDQLRPHPGIGWNTGAGGFHDGTGCRGVPKTPEHRAKQRPDNHRAAAPDRSSGDGSA